ncbi:hypothetical protein G8A07_00030 [Roseateles sp. DAIF2]|uniref:HNH endonuclease n=1 Tax=Roseateles sp. DAIF2 TaxID=2714952 RepID=UPI0018A258A1|nr:hypothetical protein G8A07_00030 [Roseateles sp. DAIF2]
MREASLHGSTLFLLRSIWASLPNSRLKDDERISFIAKAIGSSPSDAHIALSSPSQRRTRLSLEDKLVLEAKQNYRCALCGKLLDRNAEPHIDHVIPVAFGGADELINFQLLCSQCNLGKSASLHWLMIAPFFEEPVGNEPSTRMRYCTLQRHAGACAVPGCTASSKTDQLLVIQHIPIQAGGRNILDNLTVLCESHGAAHINGLQAQARQNMSRRPGFRFI